MALDFTNAPREVTTLYADALAMSLEKGQSKPEAQRFAVRQLQLAGWYRTATGWKRMAPDVRDKVNVRQAHQQPDGTFLITDVDVFYPNATKGVDWIFDRARIGRMSENTNRSIAQGAQRPALVEGHQHPQVRMLGIQSDALGYAINFRSHPSKAGWARADLVDVKPDAVQRMKERKITGLSAEVCRDAGGLNERFQRVSLLGGTLQSLSSLPVTEVYSVSNQVCFSAEGTVPPRGQTQTRKGLPMAMNANQAKEMAECYSALSAAHAAFAAGEDGADLKLDEANKKMAECQTKFGAGEEVTPAAAAAEDEPVAAAYSVGEITGEQFAADPVGTLSAMQASLSGLMKENKILKDSQATALAAAKKKSDLATFSTFCADLHTKGHMFDDTEAVAMFESAAGNEDQLKQLSAFLKKSPTKVQTGPADIGAIFSADDAAPDVKPRTEPAKEPPKTFNSGTLSFSSEDMAAGATAADIVAAATI